MSERIEFPENAKRNGKQRGFRDKFPDKQTVEARISTEIDAMKSISAADQSRLKKIFLGNADQPGLIDALFALDR